MYFKAIRDNALTCGLSTFYKYCNLLGFNGNNILTKPNNYYPLKTTKPNQVWCTDVTIFKTHDGVKHYIHILMDHFSKMVLGYQIEKHSSGKVIRHLLQSAHLKYKPKQTLFLTDGGSENVNVNVSSLIDASCGNLKHKIAQRDVLFSNSMIEAFNKVLKYQFLYPKQINYRTKLEQILHNAIETYNLQRPQLNLNGNTPFEVFNKSSIDFRTYSDTFKAQKQYK
ncbi:transposase [Formosa sp. 3Alg 14/1]